jgi:hypothetical protein
MPTINLTVGTNLEIIKTLLEQGTVIIVLFTDDTLIKNNILMNIICNDKKFKQLKSLIIKA